MARLRIANFDFDEQEACDILLGYAFGTEVLSPKPTTPPYGEPARDLSVPVFGYRTYDCVAADPALSLRPIDLLVASSLNGRVDVETMASLLEVADACSEALSELSPDVPAFWEAGAE